MLAISELVSVSVDSQHPDQIIWHKPVGRTVEEFQAIACSEDEGITMPSAKVQVPLQLAKEHEAWCPSCLAIIREARHRNQGEPNRATQAVQGLEESMRAAEQ